MIARRARRIAGLAGMIALVAISEAAAQVVGGPQGRIVGKVVAEATNAPLALVAVTVRLAGDSSLVAGALTTETGAFRIEGLGPGTYTVRLSLLGYAVQVVDSVRLTTPFAEADLGTFRLAAQAVELEAIEATAARSSVILEADRTTYIAKDLPASSGGTATDLLRQVSELEVDINGRVTLRGNQSVAIHLNGRPAPMRGEALTHFLQQLPANRISKVEVMPNPSARHDPEGMGGIVNIILKEDTDLGLSGNVSLTADSRGSRGLNGRLAYQKGRLTLFGGAGFNVSDSRNTTLDVRQNLLSNPVTWLEQEGWSESDGRFDMLDLTVEWRLGARTVAWGSAMAWGGGSAADRFAAYGLFDDAHVMLDRYDRSTRTDHSNSSTDLALGFKHQIVPQRHEITIDLRRNGHGTDGGSYVEKLSHMVATGADPLAEILTTDADTDNGMLTLRADYTRPWGERGRVDVGVNLSRRSLDDRQLQSVELPGKPPEENLRSLYTHDEDFHSAYITAAQRFGRLNLQLGVRAELAYTDFSLRSTGEQFDNDYESVFPSLNAAYDAGAGRTIRFSYSKRIGRPYAGILNPYVPSDDPLNRSIGNPDLKPSYTHSFSLDVSRTGSKGTLRLAAYHRRSVDGWESIKRVDSLGVSTVTYENTASSRSSGASATASLRPMGRFSGSANVNLYHSVTNATNIAPEYSRRGVYWSASGNVAARVTRALNAQLFAMYQPARDMPQGRMSSMLMTYLSLRQQLLNGRATVSLSANDPFDLYRYNFETRDRSHVQTSRTSMSMRSLSLSFTWNFGRPPEQNSRRDSATTQTEETVRIR